MVSELVTNYETKLAEVEHELVEARSENERHHKDFAEIQRICHRALTSSTFQYGPVESRAIEQESALKAIRSIVG